jgi:predicted nuclease with TOPRIM domain
LEKQVKELKLRVVDQETRAYATSPKSSPHVKRLEARVEELTNKLNRELKEKTESDRAFRNAGTSARDTQFQLSESERARARLEVDVKDYEMKLEKLRSSSDELVSVCRLRAFVTWTDMPFSNLLRANSKSPSVELSLMHPSSDRRFLRK